MLIPSIDLSDGRCVQLVQGERLAVDAGDPRPIAQRFARVGEVAVIDLDAAGGRGDNAELVRQLLPLAACRVGGGIRDLQTARRWLDAGAAKVILGTAATEEWVAALPRDRVIAAVDCRHGEVVDCGWQRGTGEDVISRIEGLRDRVGGFLVTFVENEGGMQGIDLERARALREVIGDAELTVAGGLRAASEIAALDRLRIDVQVGMALYTGELELADAFLAPLVDRCGDGPWSTVVCDEGGRALGLVYSDRESVKVALERGQGVYHSRRRGLWIKGESSGNAQELIELSLDCDRDALRVRVRQRGTGFCHRRTRNCWGDDRGLAALDRRLAARREHAPEGSYTRRLFSSPELLRAKLLEETQEFVEARTDDELVHEAADVFYFTMVRLAAAGIDLPRVEAELDRRARKVGRRPGDAKPGALPTETKPRQSLRRLTSTEVVVQASKPVESTELRRGAAGIVDEVRRGGDAALRSLRERFDGIESSAPLVIEGDALRASWEALEPEEQALLSRTRERIARFAGAQRRSLQPLRLHAEGLAMGHRVVAVGRAGCYAPAGKHPLISSVLMTATVARKAGVDEVVVATPSRDPRLWAAAHAAGADRLLLAGGAQAIAALAFGVDSVGACDVVVGPGNAWVSAAKSVVAGRVRIDALAGPSELVVVADASSDAAAVAGDLLAQAEHDPLARAGLICFDGSFVDAVDRELQAQLSDLATREVASAALAHSFATVVDSFDEACTLCDLLAPEHLQWMAAGENEALERLRHYGGLFLGAAAAEVLGDYGAGPNHTLPTGGQARCRGGLSVLDFLKLPTYLASRATGPSETLIADSKALAEIEGLPGHAAAAHRRARPFSAG